MTEVADQGRVQGHDQRQDLPLHLGREDTVKEGKNPSLSQDHPLLAHHENVLGQGPGQSQGHSPQFGDSVHHLEVQLLLGLP